MRSATAPAKSISVRVAYIPAPPLTPAVGEQPTKAVCRRAVQKSIPLPRALPNWSLVNPGNLGSEAGCDDSERGDSTGAKIALRSRHGTASDRTAAPRLDHRRLRRGGGSGGLC